MITIVVEALEVELGLVEVADLHEINELTRAELATRDRTIAQVLCTRLALLVELHEPVRARLGHGYRVEMSEQHFELFINNVTTVAAASIIVTVAIVAAVSAWKTRTVAAVAAAAWAFSYAR